LECGDRTPNRRTRALERKNNDLYERLEEDIGRSHELVRTLANG
jgi:hypothetical protein